MLSVAEMVAKYGLRPFGVYIYTPGHRVYPTCNRDTLKEAKHEAGLRIDVDAKGAEPREFIVVDRRTNRYWRSEGNRDKNGELRFVAKGLLQSNEIPVMGRGS